MRKWYSSQLPKIIFLLCCSFFVLKCSAQQNPLNNKSLAQQVEIRRTSYGVPHIKADNLTAAFFGLAYCQLEDYGDRIIRGLVQARGEMTKYFGGDNNMNADFQAKQRLQRAMNTYHLLDTNTREVMEGFAAGVNYFIECHRDQLPDWAQPIFTGPDVASRGIGVMNTGSVQRFLRSLGVQTAAIEQPEEQREVGSNMWALGPSRTTSGKAILMRNPHLSWTAGYYEAHVTVPGKLNFYGDFRIGGPLDQIGGFNDNLGWSTTNNSTILEQIYELDLDPNHADHYQFDGQSIPLTSEIVTMEYKKDQDILQESRKYWHSQLGPVIHRTDKKIYVMKSALHGEYRRYQQYLRMMMAHNLEEWQDAMKMRAIHTSNYCCVDQSGNIYHLWNAMNPEFPHSYRPNRAIYARKSADVWTQLVPYEKLPQLLNPPGGYLHNENDPPYFTNLNKPLDRTQFPDHFPNHRLRLRSQHALELLHNEEKFTLEQICDMKFSMRMLLADRVKADLVAAVKAANPSGETQKALAMIEQWDNTVAADSRGGVLFEIWWKHYQAGRGDYAVPWSPQQPITTPHGLSNKELAAEAFQAAIEETNRSYGSWDVAWGDVHRIRMGDIDLPIGGGSGSLGCFRVLNFRQEKDGKLVVNGGDGWIMAVEFGDVPRAYSVLAYGQSTDPASPHFNDQAALFAANKMKKVAFTEVDINAQLIKRYHPGNVSSNNRKN